MATHEVGDARSAAARLRDTMAGGVLVPGDRGYDDARRVHNGMVDARPALIAGCLVAEDVVASVRIAREHGLTVAVRGGGHNVAGLATCEGGLVIDLSRMRDVRVDPDRRTLRCGPGTVWADVDREASAFGLATPGGVISHTGVAGLTLGGGFGWLSRGLGLACDNLLAAEVVLADASRVSASATENPDLFWALRGGGGNFGVVTSFVFRLHPVRKVLAGMAVHPIERAREVLAVQRELAESGSDALAVYTSTGPGPAGQPVIALILCYNGPADAGERLIRPVRALGPGLDDTIAERPYWEFNRSLDDRHPHGLRYYWKTSLAGDLSEAATDAALEYQRRTSPPLGTLTIEQYGGAVGRVGPEETAFWHRQAAYNLVVWARWSDPAEDGRRIAWARGLWQTLQPYAQDAVYMNMLGGGSDDADRVRAAYGRNYDRLAMVKARYDPANFYHRNHNVAPAGGRLPAPSGQSASADQRAVP